MTKALLTAAGLLAAGVFMSARTAHPQFSQALLMFGVATSASTFVLYGLGPCLKK